MKSAGLDVLDAIASVDRERLLRLLAPDAVLHFQESSKTVGGTETEIRGGDTIATVFTAHHGADGEHSLWSPNTTRWHPEYVICEDDVVVVQANRTSLTAQGRPYENRYVWLFRFGGELITEIWEHCDSAYSHSVLELPTNPSDSWKGSGT
jgi:ketosteroid isomerase-like protein